MFFNRKLKSFGVGDTILCLFYKTFIQSAILYGLVSWFRANSNEKQQALARIYKQATLICGSKLQTVNNLYQQRVVYKRKTFMSDSSHHSHRHFTVLPSGVRLCSVNTGTERIGKSFIPQAISLYDSQYRR